MGEILEAQAQKIASGKAGYWPVRPLMLSTCYLHNRVVNDINIVKEDGSLAANSHLDMVGRATLLSFDAIIVCPLIALALLVEGVIRAFVGGALFLTSYIPCTGQGNVKVVGKALLGSSVVSVKEAGSYLWRTVKVPVVVTSKIVIYIKDTNFFTKEYN